MFERKGVLFGAYDVFDFFFFLEGGGRCSSLLMVVVLVPVLVLVLLFVVVSLSFFHSPTSLNLSCCSLNHGSASEPFEPSPILAAFFHLSSQLRHRCRSLVPRAVVWWWWWWW